MSVKLYRSINPLYTLMMNLADRLKVLQLSKKEIKVMEALLGGAETPLEMWRRTTVTRPAIYDILKKLHSRGLVCFHVVDGRKIWKMESERNLANTLYETKKVLLSLSDGTTEPSMITDGIVKIHQGDEAVRRVVFDLFSQHKEERYLGFIGIEDVAQGWAKTFTLEEINAINRTIKKNKLITDVISPRGWIENHIRLMGMNWARDFEGRTASAVYVDKKYFNHLGQIFAFKDVMYLIAMADKTIIEIRHSDIQKMILAMYAFMKEHGEQYDLNKTLRELFKEK